MNPHLAACRQPGVDPDWFHPDNHHPLQPTVKLALAVCSDCPIKEQCLAEHQHDEFGIFGGTTPPMRGHRNRNDRRTEARKDTHDQIAVDLLVGGDFTVRLFTPSERQEAAQRLYRKGYGRENIANLLKLSWATTRKLLPTSWCETVGEERYVGYAGTLEGRT